MNQQGRYEPIAEDTANVAQVILDEDDGDENVIQELHPGQAPTVVVEAVVEAEAADAITVKIKSSDDKNHDVRISQSGSVADLKGVLAGKTGIAADRQRLICAGKMLQDNKTLLESGVKDGNFVHLVPKAVPDSSSSGGSGGSRSATVAAEGLGNVNSLPPHIRAMLASRSSAGSQNAVAIEVVGMDGHDSRFSYEEEYELNIWRYRVRVLSLLMLMYYTMAAMASISIWLHPKEYPREGQFQQVKPDLALALVDLLENTMGMVVAITGLKAAVSTQSTPARKFAKELSILCFVHFINLILWIMALIHGEIVLIPLHGHRYRGGGSAGTGTHPHNGTHQMTEDETVHSIVGQLVILHPIIWFSILTIAYRYAKCLSNREEQVASERSDDTPVAQPAEAVVV